MKSVELFFERPKTLEATTPPEMRGLARDEVRLLVSTSSGHRHARFYELADYLRAGDLLVVNRSATVPASLPAHGSVGPFTLNLSTNYGQGLWLAEPRWSLREPGPLPLTAGDTITVAGLPAKLVTTHHGLPRLWFVQFAGHRLEDNVQAAMAQYGQPIRYGYVERAYPLELYQTIFATTPGSAEMPSAGRPFTPRVLNALAARGVGIADIVLHTGVSSHEVETDEVEEQTLYAEPFWVPAATASAVNAARHAGRRVIAVGTTVVRALEAAWNGEAVPAAQGFTHLYIHPQRGVHTIDGLISGLHDSMASHLAMLYAIAEPSLIRTAYDEAIAHAYLWHEFGDSHLILSEQ